MFYVSFMSSNKVNTKMKTILQDFDTVTKLKIILKYYWRFLDLALSNDVHTISEYIIILRSRYFIHISKH